LTDVTELTPLENDVQLALRDGLAEQGENAPALTPEQMRALSSTVARMLARRIGGRYVAFVEDRARRDAAVLADFNGRNHGEVMAKHGISRRLLYNILARHRATDK